MPVEPPAEVPVPAAAEPDAAPAEPSTKEEWWEAKKAAEAKERAEAAPAAPVIEVAGGTDYIAVGGAKEETPAGARTRPATSGAPKVSNMTSGQLKKELRARGVEPAEGASRQEMVEQLTALQSADERV